MNVPAIMGVVFGTGLTYFVTDSVKLSLLGTTTGAISAGILNGKENDYNGPSHFCQTACATIWPILLHDDSQPIPMFFEDDDEDDLDILDMPLYFD